MDIVEFAKKRNGYNELNELQDECVAYALTNENLVVSAPTSSGKTFVAEVAILKEILENNKKAIYIAPLRSIASEKYREFKNKYGDVIKIALSIGDYDSTDEWLGRYNLIIMTNEKFDSILRHNPTWKKSIGIVVIDEIHMLSDEGRGANLEILITRLMIEVSPRFICLSATIRNSDEIANWMNARAIVSNYRPVEVRKGVLYKNKIEWFNGSETTINGLDAIIEIIRRTIAMNKQVLIFVNTRKSAEDYAEFIGNITKRFVKKVEMDNIAKKIVNVIEHPTSQCIKLAECIKMGSAFHHSGLLNEQRTIVEDAFRNGLIKTVVATPTLAMGVNLPSYMVIVKDVRRYEGFRGMIFLKNIEIQQMLGRAGRKGYDDEGVAIINTKTFLEKNYVIKRYVNAQLEFVDSKLSNYKVLRAHILAIIASEIANTMENLLNFFSKTFYAKQSKSIFDIEITIEDIIESLKSLKFVKEENDMIVATPLGRRISELYIDPFSAKKMIDVMYKITNNGFNVFPLLVSLSTLDEMMPLMPVRRNELHLIEKTIFESNLYEELPDYGTYEYEIILRAIKTSKILEMWINEIGEDKIYEVYSITPGELRARIEVMEWLCYAFSEISKILGMKFYTKAFKLSRRIKYGVKEELIELVSVKWIGRKRARLLFNNGIKCMSDMKKIGSERLSKIIGKEIVKKIFKTK